MGDNRPFDHVCAICDNGGEILSCKGKCLRSFHAIRDESSADCETLGFTREKLREIENYLCSNCQHKQHQCFACGQLCSSDRTNREVHICSVSDCGYHYHVKCVSKLIHPDSELKAAQFAKDIKTGSAFTCPRHKCDICKGVENKNKWGLQFAFCRRCPVAYHRRCLPREISFEENGNNLTRAWEKLLPNRILIYCMKHQIDASLGTPIRNHLKFPQISQEKFSFKSENSQEIVLKSKHLYEFDKQPDKKRARISEETSLQREKPKVSENNIWQREKQKVSENVSWQREKQERQNYSGYNSYREKQKISENNSYREKQKVSENILREANLHASSFLEIDKSAENKVRDLWEKSCSSLTVENVREKFKMPSTHRGLTKHIDQSLTEDQIRDTVQIIRAAWNKVQSGETVGEAKEICPEDLIYQVAKWKNKMSVYLAPFLHMNRYTSFGRHFTKIDKLVEIVERLQWYVQGGDMVIDFCCGSNDFSILMRDKLESVGKKCFFKNFDLHEPKNDFNFEKRDWMTVRPEELPDGDRLIMGLNPPFGMKASLANKFIDQALKFRPKIIILIVPKETQSLYEKAEYDLTWQDVYLLSGKSFYLPGSIDDEHNRMDQWNLNPPPLYLWSRRDWTPQHKEIASKHGHLSQFQETSEPKLNPNSKPNESSSSSLSEKEEEDEEEEEEEEEEQIVQMQTAPPPVKTVHPPVSTVEEGEITDLPLGEVSKMDNNEEDVSGELIFLADMDISSPEYDGFQSGYGKGFETGPSKIQFDYSSSRLGPSDPVEPGPSSSCDWWSDEDD